MKKQFGGFTPTQQQQLLTKYGYQGPAQEDDMQKYMTANPSAALAMGRYNEMARKRVVMAYGGMVKKPGVVYASQGTLIPGDLRRDEATGTYLTGAGGATTAWQAPEGFDFTAYSSNPQEYSTTFSAKRPDTLPPIAKPPVAEIPTLPPIAKPPVSEIPPDTLPPVFEIPTLPPIEEPPVEDKPSEITMPELYKEPEQFDESGVLKQGAAVTVVQEGGKYYLKDAQGRYLSNATTTGGKGTGKYVFTDPASAQNYINTKGYLSAEDFEKQQKELKDQYTTGVGEYLSGTVERDFGDIKAQYTSATKDVETKKYELSLLNQQLQANSDSTILQQLVADKSNELNASISRVNDLTPVYMAGQKSMTDIMAERATAPTLPEGATITPQAISVTDETIIPSTSGQVVGAGGVEGATTAATTTAEAPETKDAVTYTADTSTENVNAALGTLQAAQTDESDTRAQITAAATTTSMVGNLEAAQGNAILMDNQITREIQAGELVDSTVNAEKAAAFTEQIQAAEATPSKQATVQGQLESLMQQFEGGKTPAWASGAMRTAMQTMAARGLSASSMAGQAIIQATMESALPIAMADAQTQAQFEAQNLSNRQQRAMLAAQQRATFMGQEFDQKFQARVINASKVSDVANMNFTADQQIQLENSRMVNTMNLQNLTNTQSLIMAEASALASLDLSNLNNRQQAAVQNSSNFLQLDLSNLSNEQQTALFKTQQQVTSIFSDQAAENAAKQFNAQSENQVNQFYDNLKTQVQQFNAEQKNAQDRFNAGEANALAKFNAEMANQREQFNAANQLIIDQSNATWRREVATADTEAVNRANELNAQNTLDISDTAYNNLWQAYGDAMENSFQAGENEANRQTNMTLTILNNKADAASAKLARDAASSASFGKLIGTVLTSDLSKTILGGFLE